MANDPTIRQSEAAPPQQGFGMEFKKLIPSLLLTAAVAFGTSWWNSQLTLNEIRFRLDRVEEKQKDTAAAAAASAQIAQQNAIRMAELGVIQGNVVEQLKEIKREHEQILRGK